MTKRRGRDLEPWLQRVAQVPEPARQALIHVLQIAAAVSAKSVHRSVDTVLRRTAEALGVRHQPERLGRLVEEAQGAGVMADA